ncbi:hypothetical protein FB479_101120 [Brevibacillus sp. AG162]|nr:hypothetical protein FB479_101120 [Brevibacillus sp. AG162]
MGLQRIEVRYVHFPATERGILGFKMGKNDPRCVEPNIGYPLDNPIGYWS